MSPSFNVARSGDIAYARVNGLANMRNTPILDEFLRRELDADLTTILIDLATCTGMDSTFMGFLVGFHADAGDRDCRLVLINPRREIARLLDMLGVSTMVPTITGHQVPQLSLVDLHKGGEMTPRQRAELVLAAHHNLMRLSAENREKFTAFVQAMESDLKKLD